MPWHPGAGAGCSEQRPGRTVALGYIHTYILGGRYRDAVNAWAEVLSSIGISERSQGLFALARLAAPTYCHWRSCVTCCAWVGVLGGEIKRQGIIC